MDKKIIVNIHDIMLLEGMFYMLKTSTVVVTGMECYTIFGGNKEVFWDGIVTGKIGIESEDKNCLKLQKNELPSKKVTLIIKQLSKCIKKALREANITKSELEEQKSVLICGTFLGEIGCLQKDLSNESQT